MNPQPEIHHPTLTAFDELLADTQYFANQAFGQALDLRDCLYMGWNSGPANQKARLLAIEMAGATHAAKHLQAETILLINASMLALAKLKADVESWDSPQPVSTLLEKCSNIGIALDASGFDIQHKVTPLPDEPSPDSNLMEFASNPANRGDMVTDALHFLTPSPSQP